MKTVFKLLFFFFFAVFIIHFAFEHTVYSQSPVSALVFVREGCAHCQDEEKFFTKLRGQRDDINVTYLRLENEKDNKVWQEFTTRLGISKVTPITVIGESFIIGFDSENTTGKEIISLIDKTKQSNLKTDLNSTSIKELGEGSATCDEAGLIPCTDEPTYYVSLPFIGRIDAGKYPLFALSAVLGFFDGFNPCAMWVLVTFLIILLQIGDRRKMFLFAGTFILAEAVMYSFILGFWYKTWDFVKLDMIITPVVGAVAVAGGVFFLREWRKKELECKVTNLSQRQKTRKKIEELAIGKFTLFTFLAILGIAFSVNIIEFACSIGIPQAFTKILELNQLSFVQTLLSIAVYILFYMIDDFIVFAVALWGVDKLHLTAKYSKLSNLIGGVVMIILGIILIFRPNIILF